MSTNTKQLPVAHKNPPTHKMGLIGKKMGMTQIFEENGERVPVTVVQMGPNFVLGLRTNAKDKYAAVQLGFGDRRKNRVTRAQAGFFAKKDVKPAQTIREFRLEDDTAVGAFTVGQAVGVGDVFAKGLAVDVTGTSKGKGFQGVIKKHKMKGAQTNTHGTHEFFRHGGSIGCRLTPGRTFKGKRMCGQMGNETKTIQNLEVVDMDLEKNLLLIRGAIPGGKNGTVIVRQSTKLEFFKRSGIGAPQERSKNPLKASKRGGA